MRFAAAKIGLQLNDRIAAGAGETLKRSCQQVSQSLGQEGALEKIAWYAVLIGPFIAMHLAQISGELGLLIAIRGDIGMRSHDLAPRSQSRHRLSFDRSNGDLARLASCLLLEAYTQHLLLLPLNLLCLFGGDGGEQALDAIKCAVHIIG